MTLLSYISIPYTSPSNEIKYIRINLTTNKIFVKDEEVVNINEFTDEVDCCDDECTEDCKCDKNELIDILKAELDNVDNDNDDDYIAELRNTIASLDLLKNN
jgi:hypothetical protein